MKVIIADDSKLMRERIRNAIAVFRSVEIVSETENGMQTLQELNKHNPDIAIIDIRMPELNGLETIKEFRKKNKMAVIIILSNYTYKQYRKRALENGVDYFYSKSEDFDKIADVVASMLKNENHIQAEIKQGTK